MKPQFKEEINRKKTLLHKHHFVTSYSLNRPMPLVQANALFLKKSSRADRLIAFEVCAEANPATFGKVTSRPFLDIKYF